MGGGRERRKELLNQSAEGETCVVQKSVWATAGHGNGFCIRYEKKNCFLSKKIYSPVPYLLLFGR